MLLATARLPLTPILGERSPYALIFVGVVVSCVLAGWRSGLVTLILGQLLTWITVVQPAVRSSNQPQLTAAFMFATVSQLLVLAVVALYQREVGRTMTSQEREMNLLSEALREIDHRTRNNYQTVVALILLQSQRATSVDVRQALAEAADRVRAVSLASEQLALTSEGLGTVRLGDHLHELCHQLKRGLTSDGVLLHCDFAEVTTRADTAIHLSIIVNELVTNALKHAFDDKGGEIRVRCAPDGDGLQLEIADNGSGMTVSARQRPGLGTRLVERFVKELGAEHEVSTSAAGTTHRIKVHSLA